MRRTIDKVPSLLNRLDNASARLRRSVGAVRREPGGAVDASQAANQEDSPVPEHLRPVRSDSALDQSIAALQAVVWIAAFVQSIFNEIRGRSDG